jgi:arylsulfatase A-like enzyme
MMGGMSTKVRSGDGIWKWLVWAGAGLWAVGVVAMGQGQGQARVPNVVFVMADDMGYGDLGCYGQKEIQTPRIDRLAAEGMRFTQVYSGSPVCAPARSVLMTGQHTGRTTVRGNSGLGGVRGPGGEAGRVPLRAEDVTVAEVLKGAGYVTGMTGKWGLGEPGTTGVPTMQGFDHWLGFLNQRHAHGYYPDYLWKGDEKFPLPGNEGGARGQWVHDLFTDFALDFIRAQAGGRFFLYVPYTVPHDKFEIPDLDPYEDREWTEQEKIYAAMITRMDGDIGRMVDLLEELGLSENTVIFLCSDNGAANRYEGLFDSSGPLRGRKRDLYEGGIRVPMIVRWQGTVAAGAVSDAVWGFEDVLPTLAELAGAAVPEGVTGVSVVPSLMGEAQDFGDRGLYWEFFEGGFQQAGRWRDWKAVRKGWRGAIEVFELGSDLGERRDVASEHPEVVKRFAEFFDSERVESAEWPVKK